MALGSGPNTVDNVVLVQDSATLRTGSNYYLSFDYAYSGNSGTSCTLEVNIGNPVPGRDVSTYSGGSRVFATGNSIGANGTAQGRVDLSGMPRADLYGGETRPYGGDATRLLIWNSCNGAGDVTITVGGVQYVSYDGQASDGSVVTRYSAIANPSFNDNASIAPWTFTGTGVNSTSAPDSFTLISPNQTSGIDGRLTQQVPVMSRGQFFAFTASLSFEKDSTSDVTCYATLSIPGNLPLYHNRNVRLAAQQQTWDIFASAQIQRATEAVVFAFGCTGNGNIRAVLSDVAFDLNVPGR